MSLAQLQQAIAELICDEKSLQAYQTDPDEWTLQRLGARDAKLLARVDASSLQLFHEIHARDRAYFLEALLPLTLQRLGADGPRAYFATHPYGDDDLRAEAARFAAHLRERGHDAGAIALAQYELARFLLLDEPAFEPSPSEGEGLGALELAPGIGILPADLHVPSLVEDPHGDPVPDAGVVLLRRDVDDVTTAWLDGVEAELLRAVHAKDEARLREVAATDAGRRALAQLLEAGVIQ